MLGRVKKLSDHITINFACNELLNCFKQVNQADTGVDINNKNHQFSIIIGTWENCLHHGIPLSALQYSRQVSTDSSLKDDFLIESVHGDVIVSGKCERSTLYATYQFCKDYLGLEWIYPGEKPVIKERRFHIDHKTSAYYSPSIERRGFVFETIYDSAYMKSMIDWLAKNRMNEVFFTFDLWEALKDDLAPEIEKRSLLLTLGGHSMTFIRRLKDPNIKKEEHKHSHPYVAKEQFDYEDQSWRNAFFEKLASYCRDIQSLDRISLWPEDVAISQETKGNARFIKSYIQFSEELKQYLVHDLPQIKVEHIAYNAGLSWDMLEKGDTENSQKIDTLFAYWGRDYTYRFKESYHDSDTRGYQSLVKWREATRKKNKALTVFEYYSDHFMLSEMFPFMPKRIYQDINHYRTLGVDGLLNLVVPYMPKKNEKKGADFWSDNYPWKWVHGLNSYMFCRFAWGDGFENVLDDYLQYYDASRRHMVGRYIEVVEQCIPKITGFNVPLFPARVVDPEKVNDQKWTYEVLELMKEIKKRVEPWIDQERKEIGSPGRESEKAIEDAFEKMNHYMKHLYGTAVNLEKEWGKVEDEVYSDEQE